MKPIFIPAYAQTDLFEALAAEVPWVNRQSPRDECFMAGPAAPRVYSYGNDNNARTERHTYHAVDMHPGVLALMEKLNRDFNCTYNVCVLNSYADQSQHLGWHSDNSPEQDLQHPIAVVAFGATREIWVKPFGASGAVPPEDRYAMTPGALFIMPGGFQDTHLHRIPKHSAACGRRISLTYRKLVR